MSLLTLVLKGICSLVPRIFIIHEYTRKLALYRIWYKFWHGETMLGRSIVLRYSCLPALPLLILKV